MVSVVNYIILSVSYLAFICYFCWYSIRMEKIIFELKNKMSDKGDNE